jgi:hypothetical protein
VSPVGPVIGGQIYTHIRHGWTVLMGINAGLMLFAAFVAAYVIVSGDDLSNASNVIHDQGGGNGATDLTATTEKGLSE